MQTGFAISSKPVTRSLIGVMTTTAHVHTAVWHTEHRASSQLSGNALRPCRATCRTRNRRSRLPGRRTHVRPSPTNPAAERRPDMRTKGSQHEDLRDNFSRLTGATDGGRSVEELNWWPAQLFGDRLHLAPSWFFMTLSTSMQADYASQPDR